jgi:TrpR-related protein YerC/YecD
MDERELNSTEANEMFQAINSLNSLNECKKFMRDICTISELKAMSERFQVAKKVMNNEPYRKISKDTGASTATVTRVAYWLHHGMGGYKLILDRLKS